MTTEIEAAGRRIIEGNRELECQYSVSDENDESICHCEDYESAEYIARVLLRDERETDFRLVDEAFAKSLGVEYCQSKYRLTEDGKSYLYSFGNGAMSLHIDDGCHIADPTIGQFWTAMRLFQVTVTPTGAKEQ